MLKERDMKQEDNRTLIRKEAWVIRLMQGMVGDYGNRNSKAECYYQDSQFRILYEYGDKFYININDLCPSRDFWITNEKGVPNKPLSIINIKES